MSAAADFKAQQYRFAAHLRDPAANARPPGIEDRRMAIYRDLFYNNVENFLASTFPVLKSLLSEEKWHRIARDFFARHRCHSPLFLEIPEEFLAYWQHERQAEADDPPFLLELAHYEWVELALSVAADDAAPRPSPEDLAATALRLASTAWFLEYRYPVQQIRADFQPDTSAEDPTRLLVYRGDDDAIAFMVLNPVTARLLGLMQEAPAHSASQHLEQIAGELAHPQPQAVHDGGLAILADLAARGVLRVRPAGPDA